MKTKWRKEEMSELKDQADREAALNCKEGNYLISAGAGSGKTYTLANRIIALMAEKDEAGNYKRHFSELLVMTFTKKAAAEMKDRTRDFLRKEPKYHDLLPEVESASIVTFDAFALEIVKKFHYELGLDKDVENLDEALISIKKKELLEAILKEKYEAVKEGGEARFASLIRRHEVKDDDDIVNIVLKLLAQSDLAPDADAYFETLKEKQFSQECIDSAIKEYLELLKENVVESYEALKGDDEITEACPEASEDYLSFFEGILAISDYDEFAREVFAKSFSKFTGLEEEVSKRKNDILKPFGEMKKALKVQGDSDMIAKRIRRAKEDVLEIISLAEKLSMRIEAFKKEKNAYSFADIAKLAAKAVSIPSVRKELQDRYHYIMIDEYQDTNDLQEDFVSSLGCPNVFQVGDMKQAIYGFRNANPSLFLKKYHAYSSGDGGTLYKLSANFRTRGPMLESINDLFSEIMNKDVGGVDYRLGHALDKGNDKYVEGEVDHHAALITYKATRGDERAEMEASLIAEDIREKIEGKYQIFDKGSSSYRDCSYKDFAVLVDKRSELSVYKRIFSEYKIPFEASEKGERSEAEITIVLKNLSRLASIFFEAGLEKEKKHLYVSLMRSFLYQEKDEAIFHSLYGEGNSKWKEGDLYRYFSINAKRLLESNLEDALSSLIADFKIVEKIPLLGEVKANYELLDGFEHLAASMSRLGYSLKEFSDYFEQLEKYEESFNVAPTPSGSDVVRYLTIHQSKGLEYPIIYLPSLFHSFNSTMNRKANNSSYMVSSRYGLIIPSILKGDEDEIEKLDTTEASIYLHLEKKHLSEEALSEKMRLFYVALTRAKEMAYLFEVDKGDKPRVSDPRKAKNFSDFLDCYSNKKGLLRVERRTLNHKVGEANEKGKEFVKTDFRSISVEPIEAEVSHASKQRVGTKDEGALRYGEKLHRYLELADFASKDVSWIENLEDRKKIEKVLALPLFDKASEAKVYHEYAFYDEESNLHGVIDLLLVYSDHIDLVDFKASSIDDPSYVEQLHAYQAYLAKVFKQPIKDYLLSIQSASIKGVD
ncbi:MAG: UvrD-helicase domain-containing protein [Bacilli bacterium]|nr:UvrD-helicase domain-containing protein [Bacilli bacterium]